MHSKQRNKICICLVILGQLESFRNHKGYSIIFPKILDAVERFRKERIFLSVWFQKISRPPPRRELEIPGGWGVRGPGNSRGEGAWTIKSLSGSKYHFIFDLSSNIASYRTVRSFLEHK